MPVTFIGGRHEVFKMVRKVYEVKETLTRKFVLIAPEGTSSVEYNQLFDDAYRDQVVEFNADNSSCGYEMSEVEDENAWLSGVEEMPRFQHILHPDVYVFLKELAKDIFCECHVASKSKDYGIMNMYPTKQDFSIKINPENSSVCIMCGDPLQFIYLHRESEDEQQFLPSFPSIEELEELLIQVVVQKEFCVKGCRNMGTSFIYKTSLLGLKEDASDYILSLRPQVMARFKGTGYGGM